MAARQKCETLTVQIGFYGINGTHPAAKSVNGVEVKDWKKVPLHAFITRLGADSWEMAGTISMTGFDHLLFFKRPIP